MRIGQPKFYGSIEEAERAPGKVRGLALRDVDLQNYVGRIAQFARLEVLGVGWCYKTTELPREILSLKQLKSLSVLNTPLQTFPYWLCELPKLQRLTIRGTDIQEIPPSIQHLSQLRYIDFGNNDFLEVPAELGKLRRLRHLALPDNPLSALPDEIFELPKLKRLGLAGTNFSEAEAKRIKEKFPNAAVWGHD